jgi:hypothetical protein
MKTCAPCLEKKRNAAKDSGEKENCQPPRNQAYERTHTNAKDPHVLEWDDFIVLLTELNGKAGDLNMNVTKPTPTPLTTPQSAHDVAMSASKTIWNTTGYRFKYAPPLCVKKIYPNK